MTSPPASSCKAEFAADLGKVHAGSAPSGIQRPAGVHWAAPTSPTASAPCWSAPPGGFPDTGGDPVVELQTNFGGGKTHSMLALYHMAGGTPARDLPGLDQLLSEHDATVPQQINRAVLVGTWRGPQDVIAGEGGREIRTTWARWPGNWAARTPST